MKQIEQLLKTNLGTEAAFKMWAAGIPTRTRAAAEGQLANRLRAFCHGMAMERRPSRWRPCRNLGVRCTRTATAAPGAKVYGKWPGLSDGQLNEGRDLAVTTRFQAWTGRGHAPNLGVQAMDRGFPGAQGRLEGFLNFI